MGYGIGNGDVEAIFKRMEMLEERIVELEAKETPTTPTVNMEEIKIQFNTTIPVNEIVEIHKVIGPLFPKNKVIVMNKEVELKVEEEKCGDVTAEDLEEEDCEEVLKEIGFTEKTALYYQNMKLAEGALKKYEDSTLAEVDMNRTMGVSREEYATKWLK